VKTDNFKQVEKFFPKHVKNHKIRILKEDGLYRHYRCGVPDESNMHFYIMTWPNYLAYTGDMGDYLFCRTDDMIHFMSGACRSHGYAAEKCVAMDKGDKIEEFSEDKFKEWLKEERKEAKSLDDERKIEYNRFNGYATSNPSEREAQLAALDDVEEAYDEYGPEGVYRTVSDFNLADEMPDFNDYTYRFLWCMKALEWATERILNREKYVDLFYE